MTTLVHIVSEEDLIARRAQILINLGLSNEELSAKVESGGLTGREWLAWSEIENVDYLLERD